MTDWKDNFYNFVKANIQSFLLANHYVRPATIEKQIWKSAYITPDNKQKVINGIKQAGGK